MKTLAIAFAVVFVTAAGFLAFEYFAVSLAPKRSPVIIETESVDSQGRRLAPVFARGLLARRETVPEEVRVFVRPDYVEVGKYRVDHQSVTILANRALRELGSSDVAVFTAEETPYFQVVQVLDGLRRSDAHIVWLITKTPILESSVERSRHRTLDEQAREE